LTTKRRTTDVLLLAMACVYRGIGEVDRALEWLQKGVEERDVPLICSLKSEPRYIPPRGHPRYQALLRKMNLEPCASLAAANYLVRHRTGVA
jgi:hypothetical protein